MKIRKILVPIDFSENSINALRYAAQFATSTGAGIFLLHVTDPLLLENELHGNLGPEPMMDRIRSEEFLNGIKTTAILKKGTVVNLILDEVKINDIDLIVMGTRGAENFTRTLFGTVTTKVIGKSTCPVLAVPKDAVFRSIRKVIMAVDFEKKTDKIIEEFVNLIKQQQTSILLVYVASDIKNDHQRELEKLTEDLKLKTGYSRIAGKVISSDFFPAGIESFALNIEADILVMITHHRGVFETIFDPSQTKLYAYHTSIPLMALPQHKSPVFFF